MSTVEPTLPPPRWSAFWRLMRFDRPIGILLLLWPTLWGLWVAGEGAPSHRILAIFVLGVVIMRAAGCVMNDIADRGFDPHVERTRTRPLAAGELGLRQAYATLAVLLAIALGLVLLTNRLTVLLAFAGAVLAMSYPFFKRVTHLPQLVLGVAFGWSIPMAFAAQTGAVPPIAWWLFAANILFSVIYDTEYAMVDREDDLAIGIKSTAILFGRLDLPIIAVLMGTFLALMAWIGMLQEWGRGWLAALVIAGGLFTWQLYIMRGRQRAGCFRAFLSNNWVGLALYLGLVVQYWPD